MPPFACLLGIERVVSLPLNHGRSLKGAFLGALVISGFDDLMFSALGLFNTPGSGVLLLYGCSQTR
jgi:hypothetical protein